MEIHFSIFLGIYITSPAIVRGTSSHRLQHFGRELPKRRQEPLSRSLGLQQQGVRQQRQDATLVLLTAPGSWGNRWGTCGENMRTYLWESRGKWWKSQNHWNCLRGISGNKGKMPKNGWNCQDVYEVGAVLAETCENPIAMIPLGSLMRSVDQTPTMMEHDGTPYCHISGIPKRSQKGLGLQRRHLGCPPQAWHSSSAHHRHGSVERFGLPGYRNCMEFLGCEKSEWYRKNI